MDNTNAFVGRLGCGKNMKTTRVSTMKRVIDRSANDIKSILGNRSGLGDVAYSRKISWDPKNSPRNERNGLRLTSIGGVDKDPSDVTPLIPGRTQTQIQSCSWRSGC